MINLSRNKNVLWSFNVGWGKLLRTVECKSTLSNKFWLCSSFIINLTTGHATNWGFWYLIYFAASTLLWVAGQQIATVVLCFSSFALIEFSLKWFLSFFILIALCPPVLSWFGTLAKFGTLAESTLLACWLIVELTSSINIPQWHLTKVRSCRIENKNKYSTYKGSCVALTFRTMRAWCHNLCALRLAERQLTSFPLRHWNLRNLTLQQECYLTNTRDFFCRSHSSIMLPPRQPCVFALLARWQLFRCCLWLIYCLVVYTSTPLRVHACMPLRLYASTHLYLYASTSLSLYASRALYVCTVSHFISYTPLHLYASTPLLLYGFTPLRIKASTH